MEFILFLEIRIISLIYRMKRVPHGLFVGLLTLDLQYLLDQFPPADGKRRAEAFMLALGGPATNAAQTFMHLGGQAHLATVLGQHPFRAWCEEQLSGAQIPLRDLNPQYAELPQVASIWSSQATGSRSIVNPPRASIPCDPGALQPFLNPALDIMLVDGFFLEAAIEAARFGQARGIPVVLDGGSWKPGLEALLPLLDCAICSADFRGPAGEPAQDILAGYDMAVQAITQGAGPVLWKRGGEWVEIPVPEVPVVDSLGAGDVFHGAFCFAYGAGAPPEAALQTAIEVAGRSVRHFGVHSWAV